MEKLIIENRSEIPIKELLWYIEKVLMAGRISNENTQYCYHTVFPDGVNISAFKNDRSDRLVVTFRRKDEIKPRTDRQNGKSSAENRKNV